LPGRHNSICRTTDLFALYPCSFTYSNTFSQFYKHTHANNNPVANRIVHAYFNPNRCYSSYQHAHSDSNTTGYAYAHAAVARHAHPNPNTSGYTYAHTAVARHAHRNAAASRYTDPNANTISGNADPCSLANTSCRFTYGDRYASLLIRIQLAINFFVE
jgi:hypothetical protein